MPLTYLDCFKILENHFRYVNIGYISIARTDEEMVTAMQATRRVDSTVYQGKEYKHVHIANFFKSIITMKAQNPSLMSQDILDKRVNLNDLEREIIFLWLSYSSSSAEKEFKINNPFLYDFACAIINAAPLSDEQKVAKIARLNLGFYHQPPYDDYKKALRGMTKRTEAVFRGDSRPPEDIFENGFTTLTNRNIYDYICGLFYGYDPLIQGMTNSRFAIACDIQPIGAACFPMKEDYLLSKYPKSYGRDEKIIDQTYIYVIDPKKYDWMDIYRLNIMLLKNPFKGLVSHKTLVFETIPTVTHIEPESIIGVYTISRNLMLLKGSYEQIGQHFYWAKKFEVIKYDKNPRYKDKNQFKSNILQVKRKYCTDNREKLDCVGQDGIISPLYDINLKLRQSSEIISNRAKLTFENKIRDKLKPSNFFANSSKGKFHKKEEPLLKQPESRDAVGVDSSRSLSYKFK